MGKLPYFPCYARDVLSSSKIALMSGEAFKAYWLLLCASWLEDERATLPNDQAKLQALARANASTWLEIKNEVLACFDANANGRLFSPRLLEVSLLQEKRREAGSKGGSKTQAKRQASESESEIESEEEKIEYNTQNEFERFWSAYPRKVGKQKCLAWFKSHKPSTEFVNQMLTSLQAWIGSDEWTDPKFIPHPQTWLNRGGWEDEIPQSDEAHDEAKEEARTWEETRRRRKESAKVEDESVKPLFGKIAKELEKEHQP